MRQLKDLPANEGADWAWGGNGQVQLDADPHDTIECILEALDPGDWPESIEISAWKRRVLTDKDIPAADTLEMVLEALDEEHGNPDHFPGGGATAGTEAMAKAFGTPAFSAVMVREYEVWACDPVEDFEVNVAEWVADNCPEWLENEA